MRRNFGLDIYRSIAILMVLACHSVIFCYSMFFSATPLIYLLGLGVEVFFALSGFLIGGILIRDVVEQSASVSGARKLFSFYIRRWLRTLPLYYLMVIVSIMYPLWPNFAQMPSAVISVNRPLLLANLVFIQNFRPATWQMFQPVSWSLAIEEWFYLLIAPAMVGISFIKRRRLRAALLLAFGVAVVLATLAYRTSDFLVNHHNWVIDMRQQIFMHMDALMFGVLVAWLNYYRKPLYTRLAKSRLFGAITSVMVSVIAWRFVYSAMADPTINAELFAPTVAISLMGAGFAALVMVFQAQFASVGRAPRWIVATFEHISTRSYAYYLIHWPIFVLMQRTLAPGSLAQQCAVNVIALTLTFLIAGAAHLFWERPFMRLRDHIHLIHSTPAAAIASLAAPVTIPLSRPALTTAELEEAAMLPETLQLPRARP